MEVLEKDIEQAIEDCKDLKPGSEEYLNQKKAIGTLVEANAADRKVTIDEKHKKIEKITIVGTMIAGLIAAGAKVLEVICRRESNKDWIRAEDEGFYVRQKDNK